jgi:hypothetical protein
MMLFLSHARRGHEAEELREAVERAAARFGLEVVQKDHVAIGVLAAEATIDNADVVVIDAHTWTPAIAFDYGLSLGRKKPTIVLSSVADSDPNVAGPNLGKGPVVFYHAEDDLQSGLESALARQLPTGTLSPDLRSPLLRDAVNGIGAVRVFDVASDLAAQRDPTDLRDFARTVREGFQTSVKDIVGESGLANDYLGFDERVEQPFAEYFGLLSALVARRSALLSDEARAVGRFAGSTLFRGVPSEWNRLAQWLAWQLTQGAGLTALATGNHKAIRTLFDTLARGRELAARSLATLPPGMAGELALRRIERWSDAPDPFVEHLVDRVGRITPDPGVAGGSPYETRARALDFNFASTLLAGRGGGVNLRASWVVYPEGGAPLARALIEPSDFRSRFAREVLRENESYLDEHLAKDLRAGLAAADLPGPKISSALRILDAAPEAEW